MSVEDGMIRGHGGMGLLYWAGEKFGNCKIRVVWKMEKTNSNAGVFVRVPIEPYEEWMPVFYGHEIQIDNMPELSDETEYHSTGMIYSLTRPLVPNMGKPGPEWNTFEITLDGPRTIVYLNGGPYIHNPAGVHGRVQSPRFGEEQDLHPYNRIL